MPPPDNLPPTGGAEVGGFRIAGKGEVMRIEVWGYWRAEVATSFARETAAVLQKLSSAAELILDAKNLKPQGTEGQEALRVLLRGLVPLGFSKGSVRAENLFARMQLTRLIRECGLDGRLGFGDIPM